MAAPVNNKTDGPRLRWSARVRWAREELNLRPLPCQENAGNRCANRRCPRSPPTVGGEVKRSLDVQLNVLPARLKPSPTAISLIHPGPPRNAASLLRSAYTSAVQHATPAPPPAILHPPDPHSPPLVMWSDIPYKYPIAWASPAACRSRPRIRLLSKASSCTADSSRGRSSGAGSC